MEQLYNYYRINKILLTHTIKHSISNTHTLACAKVSQIKSSVCALVCVKITMGNFYLKDFHYISLFFLRSSLHERNERFSHISRVRDAKQRRTDLTGSA